MKLIVVIPARGGSKRLPHKNILPLAGKLVYRIGRSRERTNYQIYKIKNI